MKKTIALILFCLLALTACGGTQLAAIPDVETLYGEVTANLVTSELMEITEAEIYDYFGIDAADCEAFRIWISPVIISVDEIVICKAVDAAAATRVETAMKNHLEAQANSMKNYLPEQYEKLKNYDIRTRDNYVCYVIADDPAPAYAVLDLYFED